ncbi:MAG: hypothetical protein ABI758_05540 [Candidatus Woesebacteria bacterium]
MRDETKVSLLFLEIMGFVFALGVYFSLTLYFLFLIPLMLAALRNTVKTQLGMWDDQNGRIRMNGQLPLPVFNSMAITLFSAPLSLAHCGLMIAVIETAMGDEKMKLLVFTMWGLLIAAELLYSIYTAFSIFALPFQVSRRREKAKNEPAYTDPLQDYPSLQEVLSDEDGGHESFSGTL